MKITELALLQIQRDDLTRELKDMSQTESPDRYAKIWNERVAVVQEIDELEI